MNAERELLDTFDIATVNAARAALTALVERCAKYYPEEEGRGRDSMLRAAGGLEARAEQAEDLLFQLVNFAKHHLHIEVSDEQLFNRE